MNKLAGDSSTPGPDGADGWPGVWLTDASLLLTAIMWGANTVIVKFGTTKLPPLAFNAARVVLAAILLVTWARTRGAVWPDRRRTMGLLALGVLGNGLYQVLWVFGLTLTRAGDAAVIAAATPAFVALISRMRGAERVSGRAWAGIVLSILGILLVSRAAVIPRSGASVAGDLLILAGSLCWATYTVLLKPYTRDVADVTLSALTMIGGAVALTLLASPQVLTTPWAAAPASAYVAMVVSAVGGLVFAYLFWYRGVRIIGPTRTAMYSNLQPVFAVLIAWAVLGELPSVWQGVGAASIMSGLVLART
jgi:drug/metabolite transporter (DMT)-like permease